MLSSREHSNLFNGFVQLSQQIRELLL